MLTVLLSIVIAWHDSHGWLLDVWQLFQKHSYPTKLFAKLIHLNIKVSNSQCINILAHFFHISWIILCSAEAVKNSVLQYIFFYVLGIKSFTSTLFLPSCTIRMAQTTNPLSFLLPYSSYHLLCFLSTSLLFSHPHTGFLILTFLNVNYIRNVNTTFFSPQGKNEGSWLMVGSLWMKESCPWSHQITFSSSPEPVVNNGNLQQINRSSPPPLPPRYRICSV